MTAATRLNPVFRPIATQTPELTAAQASLRMISGCSELLSNRVAQMLRHTVIVFDSVE
jgi:hypothetical protein